MNTNDELEQMAKKLAASGKFKIQRIKSKPRPGTKRKWWKATIMRNTYVVTHGFVQAPTYELARKRAKERMFRIAFDARPTTIEDPELQEVEEVEKWEVEMEPNKKL